MPRNRHDILSEYLILQANSGCEKAITQLINLWTPTLTARANRITGDPDAAPELLQETWIAIAKGLGKLRDPSRFGAWSARILQNKAADWIKSQQRTRTTLRQIRHIHPTESSSGEHSPSTDQRQVQIAIGNLHPKLRDVVYLFYMDNCSLEQVAFALDIPLGTAKTRLARARRQLKSVLESSHERNIR